MNSLGELKLIPAVDHRELLAETVHTAISSLSNASGFSVAEIDPQYSDTAAFCEYYKIAPNQTVNCVVVKASRADKNWYAACMILATTKADVNGLVRRHLGARKVSFAPMDEAVALTKMDYGGITGIGLPNDWPVLIDKAVVDTDIVVLGSGIRKSKIVTRGESLKGLANAVVLEGLGHLR
ncbi:MAG: hypothetical protein KGI45_00280 [Patescibacteria group bacterium]|nr:hypothetical protein [Patescibacteria group bacterium]MDE1966500.1 hypothetical protein [Patescibacteria group bacterium]